MRKIFMALILMSVFFFNANIAAASEVRLSNRTAEEILNDLKIVGNELGISIWGKEYYTYQGARRCEVKFGKSDNNAIRFRLNNDNSVQRILITFYYYNQRQALDSVVDASFLAAATMLAIGLSESEMDVLYNKINSVRDRFYSKYVHEKASVWCSATQRYVVLDFEAEPSHMDFYLYAHD